MRFSMQSMRASSRCSRRSTGSNRELPAPACFLLLAGLLLTAAPSSGRSGEEAWYPAEAEVPIVHLTPEEARRRAWDQALAQAAEQAGLEVMGATLLTTREGGEGDRFDQFVRFVRTSARGRVVEVDTLFDGKALAPLPEGRGEWVHRVSIRARVHPETGSPDPSFRLDLQLNQQSFREGEGLVMALTATQDCYVTVFDLYAGDSLVVVVPGPLLSDNRLRAGQTLRIPPEEAGWDLALSLPPGRDQAREMLLAVATRDSIPFPAAGPTRQGLFSLGDALLAVNQWLARIPADQRTEAVASYRIVR